MTERTLPFCVDVAELIIIQPFFLQNQQGRIYAALPLIAALLDHTARNLVKIRIGSFKILSRYFAVSRTR